jgi:hypothetical protein
MRVILEEFQNKYLNNFKNVKKRNNDEISFYYEGDEYLITKFHLINFSRGLIFSKRLKMILEGTKNSKGYFQITIDKSKQSIHRYMYEKYYEKSLKVTDYIDHINRNKEDNSIKNLRLSNAFLNSQNRTKRSDSNNEVKGIIHNKNGTYSTSIQAFGNKTNLGTFSNINEAITKRKEAEIRFNKNLGTHF